MPLTRHTLIYTLLALSSPPLESKKHLCSHLPRQIRPSASHLDFGHQGKPSTSSSCAPRPPLSPSPSCSPSLYLCSHRDARSRHRPQSSTTLSSEKLMSSSLALVSPRLDPSNARLLVPCRAPEPPERCCPRRWSGAREAATTVDLLPHPSFW